MKNFKIKEVRKTLNSVTYNVEGNLLTIDWNGGLGDKGFFILKDGTRRVNYTIIGSGDNPNFLTKIVEHYFELCTYGQATENEYTLDYRHSRLPRLLNENTYYFALINDGTFSGKLPFIYYISNKLQKSEEWYQLLNAGGHYEIKLSQDEYNYIKQIPNSIEVSYNQYADTKEKKFFY